MIDVLIISLPKKLKQRSFYIENYWLVLFTQYLSSYGYRTEIIDAALEPLGVDDINQTIISMRPKVIIYLASQKNWNTICMVKSDLAKKLQTKSILLWDDSVSISNVKGTNSIDEFTINIRLQDLLKEVKKSTAKNSYHLAKWNEESLISGRKYLRQVILEGGECEILGENKDIYFPSDYDYNNSLKNFPDILHDYDLLKKEINVLCCVYKIRKINLIDDSFITNKNKFKEMIKYLEENNLSYVQFGLYINESMITNENCFFISNNKQFIYKVVIEVEIVKKEHILFIRDLMKQKIKVKVNFKLFNSEIDTEYVKFILENVKKNKICISPTALVSGTTSSEFWLIRQKIIKLIYYKVFKPNHEKIIKIENNRKYKLRIGVSNDYETINVIQKEIGGLSKMLNKLFVDIFNFLLKCSHIEDESKLVLDILFKFKEKSGYVERKINAYLLDSFGV